MTITLVTGATRGLGRDTVRQLVAAGHTAYLGARDVDRGRALADELGARFVRLDVTDDASVSDALARIRDEGGLDVLVNNAGIAAWGFEGQEALGLFDTNVVGIIRVTEAALPVLRESARPAVVNISSALGSFAATHDLSRPSSQVHAVVYGASKAAVSMLTSQYARAIPEIPFLAVEPGYTNTELGGISNEHGRPVEVSAASILDAIRLAQSGTTDVLVEDGAPLGW